MICCRKAITSHGYLFCKSHSMTPFVSRLWAACYQQHGVPIMHCLGHSQHCMLEAICPQQWYFYHTLHATLSTIYKRGVFCSVSPPQSFPSTLISWAPTVEVTEKTRASETWRHHSMILAQFKRLNSWRRPSSYQPQLPNCSALFETLYFHLSIISMVMWSCCELHCLLRWYVWICHDGCTSPHTLYISCVIIYINDHTKHPFITLNTVCFYKPL